jgi:ankyrin repeat protein
MTVSLISYKEGPGSYLPLAAGANQGQLDAVLCLVNELAADVNQVDKYGRTALLLATKNRHSHVVSCLLELRADVNKADRHGIARRIVTG